MKVLVTGSAEFIGLAIAKFLLDSEDQVIG
jgi:nucleoside-diphosphate-sugar epimerase